MSVYSRLPSSVQSMVCGLEAWRLERQRYGGEFRATSAEVDNRFECDHEQLVTWRDDRIQGFISDAVEKVPYYRRMFSDLGLKPEDISGLDDLAKLPVLAKKDVQANGADFLSNRIPARARIVSHTSGTTGAGLRFATTREAIQEQWAVWWRYRRWHGITRDEWSAHFAGRSIVPIGQQKPPYWRIARPSRQILFSAYHMSEATLDAYADELQRRRPKWIHGYPSLLTLLASHMNDRRVELDYEVGWVTVGAENLLESQSESIERAFGVNPIQNYGAAEAAANFSECEVGRLHVDEDFSAVEFVPVDGEVCRIIGTNLSNPATPLIRYDTGDVAIPAPEDERCSCGRPGRLVQSVDGRAEDYVVLRDGRRIGRMDHVFKDLVNIREAQLYQSDPSVLEVRVVRGESFGEPDETQLLRELSSRLGSEIELDIKYVAELKRSATGKLRFVLSDIPGASVYGEEDPNA